MTRTFLRKENGAQTAGTVTVLGGDATLVRSLEKQGFVEVFEISIVAEAADAVERGAAEVIVEAPKRIRKTKKAA